MQDADPRCYGSFSASKTECRKCSFHDSCRYYAATEHLVESRSHLASFERVGEWNLSAAVEDVPAETSSDTCETVSAIARFFRYLLDLDDYSLGIIAEVVAPSDGGVSRCTVSHLGRVHGCSRQAMHRKLLDLIAVRPELSTLFHETMYKLSNSRRRFLRRRAEESSNK